MPKETRSQRGSESSVKSFRSTGRPAPRLEATEDDQPSSGRNGGTSCNAEYKAVTTTPQNSHNVPFRLYLDQMEEHIVHHLS